MITFFNPNHVAHAGQLEMYRGELVPCFEVPSRADRVLAELEHRQLGSIQPASLIDGSLRSVLEKVHSSRYLQFLERAWGEWIKLAPENSERDALPSVWSVRGMRSDRLPSNFAARMGLFSFDMGTPLTAGTWQAAIGGAGCALSAANRLLAGERGTFALTRPPGHHAGADFFGGYCFINNAAVAAQVLLDGGMARVAILDIDYHHGNGTQAIFYRRSDVMFASIHGDPSSEYPFFLGYADETGEGDGVGYNHNLPLPKGSDFDVWGQALTEGLDSIFGFKPDGLVVSLGVDTFIDDPISGFRFLEEDYLAVGRQIANIGLPTVFVMEGGYALEAIGRNVANVLQGFDTGKSTV